MHKKEPKKPPEHILEDVNLKISWGRDPRPPSHHPYFRAPLFVFASTPQSSWWPCYLVLTRYHCYLCSYNVTIPVGAVAYSYSYWRFGRGVDTNLTSFMCYGYESHLLNCTYNEGSCNRRYTAGVLCYGDVVSGLLYT